MAFTGLGTPEVSDDTRVEMCVDSVDTELVSSWNASSVSFCLFLHIVISRDIQVNVWQLTKITGHEDWYVIQVNFVQDYINVSLFNL